TFAGGVFVLTGAGADTVVVQSTRADAHTAVFTGGGDDTVMVASQSDLARAVLGGVRGGLTVDAGPQVNRLAISDAAGPEGGTGWGGGGRGWSAGRRAASSRASGWSRGAATMCSWCSRCNRRRGSSPRRRSRWAAAAATTSSPWR